MEINFSSNVFAADAGKREISGRIVAWNEKGYTIVEAGLMGTPSVCFIGTAQSELVIDGTSGYIINRLEDLQKIIDSIRSNQILNEKIGNLARLEFAKKFSQELIGRRYLDLYEK